MQLLAYLHNFRKLCKHVM